MFSWKYTMLFPENNCRKSVFAGKCGHEFVCPDSQVRTDALRLIFDHKNRGGEGFRFVEADDAVFL